MTQLIDRTAASLARIESVAFRAMGSPCRITVGGGRAGLADEARRTVETLESLWSRFRADSEISELNRHAGVLVIVSPATYELLAQAEAARSLTGGVFNPLMLTQLRLLGYDAPWSGTGPSRSPQETAPASQEPIDLMEEIRGVRIPQGTQFDPGGIGKGLAIDRVTDFLLASGASSAAVELGGDLRFEGTCWYEAKWRVAVADPRDGRRDCATITAAGGAVTTSSRVRRSWKVDDLRLHHLLDPLTGQPARSDLLSVTTISSAAWWAEVAAKAVLISGLGAAREMLDRFGTPGIAVSESGAAIVGGSRVPEPIRASEP